MNFSYSEIIRNLKLAEIILIIFIDSRNYF